MLPIAPSTARNARWIATAQIGKIAIQLVSLIILARLLNPSDYGQIAMLVVITNFVFLLHDLGLGSAIIRSPSLPEGLTRTVFGISVVFASVIMLVLAAIAWPLAALFRDEGLVPLIWWLAPSVLIAGLGTVPRALLERESRFAEVAIVEVTAALGGLVCSTVLAWKGFGALCWVGATLFAAMWSSAWLLGRTRWRPRVAFDPELLREVMRYSGNLSAFNIVLYFARNADSMLIGRYLGAIELGFYSTAYRVMLFPVQNLTFVANRALFPVMAHHQADKPKIAQLYLASVGFIVFFTAPLMAGVFVLREPLVAVILGPQWGRVADLLAWLAPVGLVQSVMSTTGTVSMVTGRTDLLFRVGLFGSALQVLAFFIGVQWDAVAVAACYLAANLLQFVPAMLVALRQLDLGLAKLFAELRTSLVAALLMSGALCGIAHAAHDLKLHAVVELAAGSAIGMLLYLALMALVDRPRLRATWRRVRGR